MVWNWIGAVNIVLVWVSMFLVMTKWPTKLDLTFSQNVASNRKRFLTWALIMTITLTLFLITVLNWLKNIDGLAEAAIVLVGVAGAFEFGAAYIPDPKEKLSITHNVFAYGSASLLPFILGLIASTSGINHGFRVICLIVIAIEVLIFASLALLKAARKRYLIFQCCYIVSFHIAILVGLLAVK